MARTNKNHPNVQSLITGRIYKVKRRKGNNDATPFTLIDIETGERFNVSEIQLKRQYNEVKDAD